MSSWKELQSRLPTDKELEICKKPGFGVGLITGKVSGIAIVDLDGSEGLKTGSELKLGSTTVSMSGSGTGRHLFYRMPQGLKNSVKNLPGLDVRAEGGFCVLAPSIHSSGRNYKWLTFVPNSLPEFPQNLLQTSSPSGTAVPVTRNPEGWLAEALKEMKLGNIDNTLVKILGRMRSDNWTKEDALTMLTPHALAAGATPEHLPEKVDHVWSSYEPRRNTLSTSAMSGNALLNSKDTTEWLVKGIMPQHGISFVVGMQGIGKTWLALDLAVGLTTPRPEWLGHFPAKPAEKVLYMDEESSVALLSDRIKLVAEGRRADLDRITFLVKQGWDLQNPSSLETFKNHIKTAQATVLILDSYSCFHTGDDISTEHSLKMMKTLKNLAHETKVSIVIVDHMATGAVFRAPNDPTPVSSNDIAGSKIKARQCDSMIVFQKKGEQLVANHVKSRYAVETRPFFVSLVENGSSLRPQVTAI